jgi:pathogenesis-related protein 1
VVVLLLLSSGAEGRRKKKPPPSTTRKPPPPSKKPPPPPASKGCPRGSSPALSSGGGKLCRCNGNNVHWVKGKCVAGNLANSDLLDFQNEARAAVGVNSFIWNSSAAAACASWLNTLAKKGCAYDHPPEPYPYGQNLAAAEDFDPVSSAVETWVDEGAKYTLATMPNGCSTGNIADCGHYTQVVWRASTSVGCAVNDCNNINYVCCDYYPRGNVLGQKPY